MRHRAAPDIMVIISRRYGYQSMALDVTLGEDCPLLPTLQGVETNQQRLPQA